MWGFRRVLIGGAIFTAAVMATFALVEASTPHWLIVALVSVFGIARGTQFITTNTLTYADMPASTLSRSTSLGGVIQQLTISFGVSIAAVLLARGGGAGAIADGRGFPPGVPDRGRDQLALGAGLPAAARGRWGECERAGGAGGEAGGQAGGIRRRAGNDGEADHRGAGQRIHDAGREPACAVDARTSWRATRRRCRRRGRRCCISMRAKPDGSPAHDYEAYRDSIRAIREASRLILHPTLGQITISGDEARSGHIRRLVEDGLAPEFASVDLGSTNIDIYDKASEVVHLDGQDLRQFDGDADLPVADFRVVGGAAGAGVLGDPVRADDRAVLRHGAAVGAGLRAAGAYRGRAAGRASADAGRVAGVPRCDAGAADPVVGVQQAGQFVSRRRRRRSSWAGMCRSGSATMTMRSWGRRRMRSWSAGSPRWRGAAGGRWRRRRRRGGCLGWGSDSTA